MTETRSAIEEETSKRTEEGQPTDRSIAAKNDATGSVGIYRQSMPSENTSSNWLAWMLIVLIVLVLLYLVFQWVV